MITKTYKLTRNVNRAERTADGYGIKNIVVGSETVDVKLSIDMDKLFNYISVRMRRGQDKATRLEGCIKATVVK